jgi:P27 family predicted phage terminase small subunit
MGLRGPKPKTAAQHLARGNPRKLAGLKERVKAEARLKPGNISPPECLDVEGKREFARVLKYYQGVPVVTALDRNSLTLLCQAWSNYLRAMEHLKDSGNWVVVLTNKSGQEYEAPSLWLKIMEREREYYRKACAAFGMTPGDKERLNLEQPQRKT